MDTFPEINVHLNDKAMFNCLKPTAHDLKISWFMAHKLCGSVGYLWTI